MDWNAYWLIENLDHFYRILHIVEGLVQVLIGIVKWFSRFHCYDQINKHLIFFRSECLNAWFWSPMPCHWTLFLFFFLQHLSLVVFSTSRLDLNLLKYVGWLGWKIFNIFFDPVYHVVGCFQLLSPLLLWGSQKGVLWNAVPFNNTSKFLHDFPLVSKKFDCLQGFPFVFHHLIDVLFVALEERQIAFETVFHIHIGFVNGPVENLKNFPFNVKNLSKDASKIQDLLSNILQDLFLIYFLFFLQFSTYFCYQVYFPRGKSEIQLQISFFHFLSPSFEINLHCLLDFLMKIFRLDLFLALYLWVLIPLVANLV